MSSPTGWFADIDKDAAPAAQWVPCLQAEAGMCLHFFGIWFTTEAACLDFIKREVIGQTLLSI